MLIRKEKNTDFEEVYKIIKTAFETAEHSDGNEQDLVVSLRESKSFISELSLVAECDGKIVGHISFTKVHIGDKEELALAPLSVLPKYQRQGIGRALINEGHKIAKELGFKYSIVLGDENYYPRLGYIPANKYGIKAPFDVPSANFMAFKVCDNVNSIKGVVKYADEFGI